MLRIDSCARWCIGAIMLIFFICTTRAALTSGFTNPLNNKKLDLFFLVDETNQYMSSSQLQLVKRAIYDISLNLNPSGSSPYFGVYFYGAAASVDTRVHITTTSAAALKINLDPKPYVMQQTNPSNLVSALNVISSHCASWCRSDAPRVTLIFSGDFAPSANSTIRSLERSYGMTFMLVPIGVNTNNNLLNANQLASYPTNRYTIPVSDALHMTLFNDHISSIIADIPRLSYNKQALSISYLDSYTYYTFQVNTAPHTLNNEAIVTLASICGNCNVFASLTEQVPMSGRTPASSIYSFYPASGSVNYVSYIRVPKGTARVFISYWSSSAWNNIMIISDVVSMPAPLSMPVARAEVSDIAPVIG